MAMGIRVDLSNALEAGLLETGLAGLILGGRSWVGAERWEGHAATGYQVMAFSADKSISPP